MLVFEDVIEVILVSYLLNCQISIYYGMADCSVLLSYIHAIKQMIVHYCCQMFANNFVPFMLCMSMSHFVTFIWEAE